MMKRAKTRPAVELKTRGPPPSVRRAGSRAAGRLKERAAAYGNGQSAARAEASYEILSEGSTGKGVAWLQDGLARSGYLADYSATTDGASSVFDGRTREALMDWQRSRGLPVSGYFGPISKEVMMAEVGATNARMAEGSVTRALRHHVQQLPALSENPAFFAGSLFALVAALQVKVLISGRGAGQAASAVRGASVESADDHASIRLPPLPLRQRQGAAHQTQAPLRHRLQYNGVSSKGAVSSDRAFASSSQARGDSVGGGSGNGRSAGGSPRTWGWGKGKTPSPARGRKGEDGTKARSNGGKGATLSPPDPEILRKSGVWFVDTRTDSDSESSPVSSERKPNKAVAKTARPAKVREPRRQRGNRQQQQQQPPPPPKRSTRGLVQSEPKEREASAIQQKYAGAVERARQRLEGKIPVTASVSAKGASAGAGSLEAAQMEGVFSISNLQKKVISLNDTVETLSGRQGRLEELQAQIDSLESVLKIKTDPPLGDAEAGWVGGGGGDPGAVSEESFARLRWQLGEISKSVDQRVSAMLQENNDTLERRLAFVEHQLEGAKAQNAKREQVLAAQITRLEALAKEKLEVAGPSDKQLGWFGFLGALLGYAATKGGEMAPEREAIASAGVLDALSRRIQGIEDKLKMKPAGGGSGKGDQALVDIDQRLKALEKAWAAPEVAPQVAEPPRLEPKEETKPPAVVSPPKIDTSVTLWRLDHGREILLQGFHWESHSLNWYDIIREKVPEIKAAGFSGVWFPPPSDSIAPQGYLPRDLYNLNTKYGTMDELKRTIACMEEHALHPMADVVINHRCATSRGAGGKWNRWEGTRMDWDERAICRDNHQFGGQGNHNSGDDFTAAPNIDHSQAFVREDLKKWLVWLLSHEVGFRSLRFDFTKGYSGKYVGEYVEACAPEFSVGEFWETCNYGGDGSLSYDQDHHRQRVVDWCDQAKGKSAAFDFTTKGVLQEAVGRNQLWRLVDREGRPPGVMGVWPSHAVTFLDNHDTGSTQAHWPFPSDKILWGYAYILTHPGTPTVFWDHLFDWGPEVREGVCALVAVRRRKDIHSRTRVEIVEAKDHVYAAYVGDSVAVKIGQGHWGPVPGAGFDLTCSGDGWAVWEK